MILADETDTKTLTFVLHSCKIAFCHLKYVIYEHLSFILYCLFNSVASFKRSWKKGSRNVGIFKVLKLQNNHGVKAFIGGPLKNQDFVVSRT